MQKPRVKLTSTRAEATELTLEDKITERLKVYQKQLAKLSTSAKEGNEAEKEKAG
jgi:hypothetical protein